MTATASRTGTAHAPAGATRAALPRAGAPSRGAYPADRSSSALAASLARPIMDVLFGRRPLHQVRSRLAPQVRNLLGSRALRNQLGGATPDRLRSLHARAVDRDHVEGCAVISTAGRARALVMRWERSAQGWLCTFLSPV